MFGTAHIPNEWKKHRIRFDNDENYPQDFWNQLKRPFKE